MRGSEETDRYVNSEKFKENLSLDKNSDEVVKDKEQKVTINKFSIIFPGGKKVIPYEKEKKLKPILQKICLTAKLNLEDCSIFDGKSEELDYSISIGEVEGDFITLKEKSKVQRRRSFRLTDITGLASGLGNMKTSSARQAKDEKLAELPVVGSKKYKKEKKQLPTKNLGKRRSHTYDRASKKLSTKVKDADLMQSCPQIASSPVPSLDFEGIETEIKNINKKYLDQVTNYTALLAEVQNIKDEKEKLDQILLTMQQLLEKGNEDTMEFAIRLTKLEQKRKNSENTDLEQNANSSSESDS